MIRKISRFAPILVTTLVALAGVLAGGCSSSKTDDTPAKSGTKTCADVAKCCDKLSEPQKSICTALAGPKVEAACASGYEQVCGGADGGADGGGEETSEPTDG